MFLLKLLKKVLQEFFIPLQPVASEFAILFPQGQNPTRWIKNGPIERFDGERE